MRNINKVSFFGYSMSKETDDEFIGVNLSSRVYDEDIIGIVVKKSRPSLGGTSIDGVDVATRGRAPLRVSIENGPIKL